MNYLRYLITLCISLYTSSAWCTREAYVVVEDSVMTFYYDEFRDTHQANTYLVEPYLYGIPSKEKEQTTHVQFSSSFADARPTSTKSWFYRFWNLRHIDGMENLKTSEVTDMSMMFAYCSSLDSVDVSRFDTSKVEDMEGMFYACSSLTELDLSSFDISHGCGTSTLLKDCTRLRQLHVSHSMARLSEYSCPHVGEQTPCVIYAPESFDFGVDTGHGPFSWRDGTFLLHNAELPYACHEGDALTFHFDRDWEGTDMNPIYINQAEQKTGWIGKGWTKSITSVSISPSFASYFPVSTRRWMDGMSSLTKIEGMEYLNTSNAEDMTAMFRGCTAIDTLDLSHFNLSGAKEKDDLLKDCTGLKFLSVSSSMAGLPEGACTNVGKDRWCVINPPVGFPFGTDTSDVFFDWKDGHFALHGAELSYAMVDGSELAFYRDNRWETQQDLHFLTLNKSGEFPKWYPERQDITSVRFHAEFSEARPKSTRQWFDGMNSLERIEGWENLNTCMVTDMGAMFRECRQLPEINLEHFDTSNVTDMESMFEYCFEARELDVSKFDTSNVTDMGKMFYYCRSITDLDLTHFNTSKVEDMNKMFFGTDLKTIDVSHFDTSNTTNTEKMLNCFELRKVFLSSTMGNLAEDALYGVGQKFFTSLVVPEGLTINADTINGCYRWKGARFYVPGRDAPYATIKEDVLEFRFDSNWYDSVDSSFPLIEYSSYVQGWTSLCEDVRLVRFLESFANARPVSVSGLLAGMKSLEKIEGMKYLNTSEAKSMWAMFQDCQQLVNIDGLESLNTSKVTDMNSMFRNCHQLESMDMNHFDTSKVTTMDYMFYNCHALKTIDLSHFDTSQLNNFYFMFIGCDNLECLNLTNFQLNTPYDMQTGYIISNLTNLKELYISESLNKNLVDDECKNIGSMESPCILHAPEGIFEDRQDTNWFYWKGGIFKWPDTDKIDAVASDTNPSQGACYNLQGMRVMPGQKGVYIRNGMKYVVR